MTGLSGARVLIVEDEALVAMLLEAFLDEMGCQVVGSAARLEDAMQKAGTLELDIAVLDVNLAGKLSYPVAAILQQRGIPFLFATGYGTAGVPDDIRTTTVLAKPFSLDSLAGALQVGLSAAAH